MDALRSDGEVTAVTRKRKPSSFDEDWFDDFFRGMMEDMQRMLRQFRELERMDFETLGPNVSGFSIRFVSNGKNPPKIEVQRFGPPPPGIRPIEEEQPVRIAVKGTERPEHQQPRRFEEAPYTYHLDVREVRIELQVPGVKDPSNVDLNFQPESLEIRIYPPGQEKAYFAVLKIPPNVVQSEARVEVEKDRVIVTIPRGIYGVE